MIECYYKKKCKWYWNSDINCVFLAEDSKRKQSYILRPGYCMRFSLKTSEKSLTIEVKQPSVRVRVGDLSYTLSEREHNNPSLPVTAW